jgi:peptidoglycan hydrolase-like protein with peptidoglycan-binding domain
MTHTENVIRIPDKTAYVRRIQRFLLEIAYAEEYLPRLVMDGVYGLETEEAVLLFQRNNRLPENGIVDAQTYRALYLAYKEGQRKNGRSE